MRIGIDIDGVITDMEYWYQAFKQTLKELGRGDLTDEIIRGYFLIDNMTEKVLTELLACDYDTYKLCLSENLYKYYTCREPRAEMAELTVLLKSKGVELFIITARNEESIESKYVAKLFGMPFEQFTKNYLKKFGIVYDRLLFDAGYKADVVEQYRIDLMIDDYIKNLECIKESGLKCNCIYYDYGYNHREGLTDFVVVKSVTALKQYLLDIITN